MSHTLLQRRRRILLHFFLGIGVPSLLLAYLAFRGIQNDLALLERERLNEHEAIAGQIVASFEQELASIEESFLAPAVDDRVSLRSIDGEPTVVEAVFRLDEIGQVQYLAPTLLFVPDTGAAEFSPGLPSPAMLAGRQYEFQQNRYREALVSYQQAFTDIPNRQMQAQALSAIARVQRKVDRVQEAIASYETLAREYRDVRIGGVPAELAARLELATLSPATGDSNGVLEGLLDLYEDLLGGTWGLDKAQYRFIVQQLQARIHEVFSQTIGAKAQASRFETLKDLQAGREESTEKLLAFQDNAAAGLLARVSRGTGSRGDNLRRFTLDVGARTYLVSLAIGSGAYAGPDSATRGLLFDSRHLRETLLRSAIERHTVGRDVHWVLAGRDGEILLGSDDPIAGSQTVRTGFVRSFPPWSIELYQRPPTLLEALLTSRRGIYVGMFVLLAGILVFGLTLTVRIVTQELELARMKSDFVSTVSHEFKSPLTSIRQLAEMLQAGRVRSEERCQRYYDVLLEQSERLSLLIDNILDFARMEEGGKPFHFEMLDVAPLLEELVATVQQRVRHEGFIIRTELDAPLPPVRADQAALTQAVTNLLDNALKYSGQAREVCVRAHAAGQSLIIAVEDSGIGIRSEEVERVFDRFYRGGDELTRSVKGSGLGLTLVKQIIEAHGGTVHVESTPGQGSAFSMRLPIQSPEVQ